MAIPNSMSIVTGPYHVYMVRATLENGDKRSLKVKIDRDKSDLRLQRMAPKKSSTEEGTEVWTGGGTGKYKGVHGFQWNHGVFDIDKGLNQRLDPRPNTGSISRNANYRGANFFVIYAP